MAFSGKLSALLIIASLFIVAHVSAIRENELEFDDRAKSSVAIVTKIIKYLFTGAATSCLSEAASECKGHASHPKDAISCAKNFLQNNKGKCAVGA